MKDISLTVQEKEAILTLCWLAAQADGKRSDAERAELRRIAESTAGADVHVEAIHDRVLANPPEIQKVVVPLSTDSARRGAYEMAVCVCNADGALTESEKVFLSKLRQALGMEVSVSNPIEASAVMVSNAAGSPDRGTKDTEVDGMVKNYAILSGALELLPDSIAHFSILPLRLRMVYRIGKVFGHTLDAGHAKELLAATGLSMTSQMVEGFARKILGAVAGKLAGGLGRAAGHQAASSGLAFATTYALGHLAKKYYGGGRNLSALEIRETFQKLMNEARGLQGQFTGDIQRQAAQVDTRQLSSLVSSQ